jgi:hypothetical protein
MNTENVYYSLHVQFNAPEQMRINIENALSKLNLHFDSGYDFESGRRDLGMFLDTYAELQNVIALVNKVFIPSKVNPDITFFVRG